ncbi:MAG TPA: hypothetical protein VNU45_18795 [Rummeliibacillus sp.]|nr:hypothetical protein [Rummeliibacillus sp.]
MPYIDLAYYLDDYKGKPITDQNELDRNIQRASEYVDMITNYQIGDITKQPTFIVGQIKKAAAFLTEYFIINGGYDTQLQDNVNSISIDDFSYSTGGRKGSNNGQNNSTGINIPTELLNILVPTGLLYAGISVGDSSW